MLQDFDDIQKSNDADDDVKRLCQAFERAIRDNTEQNRASLRTSRIRLSMNSQHARPAVTKPRLRSELGYQLKFGVARRVRISYPDPANACGST